MDLLEGFTSLSLPLQETWKNDVSVTRSIKEDVATAGICTL